MDELTRPVRGKGWGGGGILIVGGWFDIMAPCNVDAI